MNKFTNPLENLKIASPCSADWNEMVGDNRKRFCGSCKLNVYNLSGMNKLEAEQLLSNSEGRLCVRFYTREDGTVLTEDCPVGWAAIKKRVSKTAAAFVAIIFGIISGLGFTSLFGQKESVATMGDVAYSPTPKRTPKKKPTPDVPQHTMGMVAPSTPTPTPKQTPRPKMGKIAVPKNTPNSQVEMGEYVAYPEQN